MKNEELFKLAEEFKVDDEYIDEALIGGSESRGIKVYAGKTRPIKILAPIAACLAVFTAAGVLFANRDKLPIRGENGFGSPASAEEVESGDTENSDSENSNIETADNNDGESTETGNTWTPPYHTLSEELWGWGVPSLSKHVYTCESYVLDHLMTELPNDITWQTGDIDFDYDGSYEIVLCPRSNGKPIKGVGACVFKKYDAESDPVYIGSFGNTSETLDLDNIYLIFSEDTKTTYYFQSFEGNMCADTIQELRIENDKLTEQAYLRLIKFYPGIDLPYTQNSVMAYRYGDLISTEELLEEWDRIRNIDELNGSLPQPNVSSDTHFGKQECVQQLIEKYNVPADAVSLHRAIQYIDLNEDGVDETVIEFRNCEQLRGMYVFSADNKLIGEFDLEGNRGQHYAAGQRIDTVGKLLETDIRLYDDGEERFYYYVTTHGQEIVTETRYEGWGEGDTFRIVVNDDGTLGSIAVIEYCYRGSGQFRINGEEATRDELWNEETKYALNSTRLIDDRAFIW